MFFPKNFIWKVYCCIFGYLSAIEIISLFHPESTVYVYYHTLISLNKGYIYVYASSAIRALVTFLALIPVLLFTFRVPLVLKPIWQIFFFIRIFFDLVGYQYEVKMITAEMNSDLLYGLSTAALIVLPLFPSYLAHYLYAFTSETKSQ